MDELQRFTETRQNDQATALSKNRAGRKRSHWMWCIFQKVAGFGHRDMARNYAIRDLIVYDQRPQKVEYELTARWGETHRAILEPYFKTS